MASGFNSISKSFSNNFIANITEIDGSVVLSCVRAIILRDKNNMSIVDNCRHVASVVESSN